MISDAQLVLRPMTTHQIGLAGFLHLLVLSQRVRKVAPPHPNGRQDARHSNGSRLLPAIHRSPAGRTMDGRKRSEEHTSELQSLAYLVCRLLLEKKKKKKKTIKRTLVSAL